jgi:hypothetical protein
MYIEQWFLVALNNSLTLMDIFKFCTLYCSYFDYAVLQHHLQQGLNLTVPKIHDMSPAQLHQKRIFLQLLWLLQHWTKAPASLSTFYSRCIKKPHCSSTHLCFLFAMKSCIQFNKIMVKITQSVNQHHKIISTRCKV